MDSKTADLNDYLATLTRRHGELDSEIQAEMQRPRPNEEILKRLKRRKLRLKDRIAALSQGPTPNFDQLLA